MKGSDRREQSFDTAESETLGMWGSSMRGNREALQTPTLDSSAGRSKKANGRNFDHARLWGVGRPHSTREAGEQSRRGSVGSGVRRGKEGDRGERDTSALVPDTEPGKRVTGFVARTASCDRAAGRQINPR